MDDEKWLAKEFAKEYAIQKQHASSKDEAESDEDGIELKMKCPPLKKVKRTSVASSSGAELGQRSVALPKAPSVEKAAVVEEDVEDVDYVEGDMFTYLKGLIAEGRKNTVTRACARVAMELGGDVVVLEFLLYEFLHDTAVDCVYDFFVNKMCF